MRLEDVSLEEGFWHGEVIGGLDRQGPLITFYVRVEVCFGAYIDIFFSYYQSCNIFKMV